MSGDIALSLDQGFKEAIFSAAQPNLFAFQQCSAPPRIDRKTTTLNFANQSEAGAPAKKGPYTSQ